jgi:hypothetical protein
MTKLMRRTIVSDCLVFEFEQCDPLKHMIQMYLNNDTPKRLVIEVFVDIQNNLGDAFYVDIEPNRATELINLYCPHYELQLLPAPKVSNYNRWLLNEIPWKEIEIDDERETYDGQYISYTILFNEEGRLIQLMSKYNKSDGTIGYESENCDCIGESSS